MTIEGTDANTAHGAAVIVCCDNRSPEALIPCRHVLFFQQRFPYFGIFRVLEQFFTVEKGFPVDETLLQEILPSFFRKISVTPKD